MLSNPLSAKFGGDLGVIHPSVGGSQQILDRIVGRGIEVGDSRAP